MKTLANVRYTGSTPGADANVYVLYATVDKTGTGSGISGTATGQDFLAMAGVSRVMLDIEHTEAFTLNWYKSSDRGTTWHQVGTLAVAAPAASTTNQFDILVDALPDFYVAVVNGGVAQATWAVNIALVGDRSIGE